MEGITPQIILAIIKRWKYIIIIPMLVLMTISAIVAVALPPVYQSSATILIEQQHIPSELVKSTVTSYADERIKLIEQRVMTVNNLSKVIDKYNMYLDKRQKLSQSELVDLFKGNAQVELVNADITNKGNKAKATIAFKLVFMDKSATTAQRVANELVTLFLSENVRTRTQSAEETSQFLEEEADKLKDETQKIEAEIAEYKQKYSQSLPELMSANMTQINRIESEIEQLTLQEKLTSERRINFAAQLTSTSPTAISTNANANGAAHATAMSLSELKVLESNLISKYSESHPDVLQVRRQIENMKKSSVNQNANNDPELLDLQNQLVVLKQKYSDDHPDVKSLQKKINEFDNQNTKTANGDKNHPKAQDDNITNPIYIQLKSEMDIADLELQSIRAQKVSLQDKLQNVEKNIAQTHQVERGYSELERDLENHKKKYQELKEKELEAKLSQTLEEEQKAETFSLIEPPVEAYKPIKPNRFKLFIMGIAGSIGSGLGAGFVMELLFGGIRGYEHLTTVLSFEPLVVIPYLPNKADILRAKRTWNTFWLVILISIVVLIVAIHFLYMPLDILFYKIWERLILI